MLRLLKAIEQHMVHAAPAAALLNEGMRMIELDKTTRQSTEMAEFMRVLRRALLLIVRYIEHTYPEAR